MARTAAAAEVAAAAAAACEVCSAGGAYSKNSPIMQSKLSAISFSLADGRANA